MRGRLIPLVAVAALVIPSAQHATQAQDQSTEVMSQDSAPYPDAPALAALLDTSEDAARQALDHQARFGELLTRLAADYPDTFAGGWTVRNEAGRGYVRFKGAVPTAAKSAAMALDLKPTFLGEAAWSLS